MTDSRVHYIEENADLLSFLDVQGIPLNSSTKKQLAFISRKNANNQIGYYQFVVGQTYHKFFVIPKIHKDEPDKEKAFFDYFSRFFELSNKYLELKNKSVRGNIVDLSFDDFKDKTSGTIEEFIQYKYLYALKVLDKFFRKHNKTRVKKRGYSAQSIDNKLDLNRNIRELDKTNVHQIKKEKELYSEIAAISEQVLKQFKFEKIKHLSQNKDEVTRITNAVLNHIKKRFKASSNLNFKDRLIITNRIRKLFKGSKEMQEVYYALLILIGLEQYNSDQSSQEAIKLENMVALFFNPADLYEWIVYDHYKQLLPEVEIIKDKVGKGTSASYFLQDENGVNVASFDSRPDLIILQDDSVMIIDAKWKVLQGLCGLDYSDIAKLKRDFEIRKDKLVDKEVKNLLVYPKVEFGVKGYLNLDFDNTFQFEVHEISV